MITSAVRVVVAIGASSGVVTGARLAARRQGRRGVPVCCGALREHRPYEGGVEAHNACSNALGFAARRRRRRRCRCLAAALTCAVSFALTRVWAAIVDPGEEANVVAARGSRRTSCAVGGRGWVARPLLCAGTRGARRNFLLAPLDVAAGVIGGYDLRPSTFVLNHVEGWRGGTVTAAPGDNDGRVVGAAVVCVIQILPPDVDLVAYVEKVGVRYSM